MNTNQQQDTDVVVRYADKRGQLVVDGQDIAGSVAEAYIRCVAGRSWLTVVVDVYGTRLEFESEAVELIATLPMSVAARRTLASLARDEPNAGPPGPSGTE